MKHNKFTLALLSITVFTCTAFSQNQYMNTYDYTSDLTASSSWVTSGTTTVKTASLNSTKNITFTLYNTLSKVVFRQDSDKARSLDVNAENLPAGVYYYKIMAGNSQVAAGKVVME